VYGPSAYLADVLRFLDTHAAATGNRTVRDVLVERRPDLGAVKLNCANTDTPLPYIDVVNEVLEAAIPGSAAAHDHQTTWTPPELRAAPEHQDNAAYDVLRQADFPMTLSFDLWEEQARVLLDHLGVPRWRLMETFRTAAGAADQTEVAAEYFGISTHEAAVVTSAQPQEAEQALYWGFDATRSEIGVPEVLEHSGLTYSDLLLTLQAHWITPDGAPRVVLARPPSSAALSQQVLLNISPDVLDRLHRLLRLGRHVSWDMWELDLLVRAERVADAAVDAAGLAALHVASLVADRLGVGAEQLATWFGQIPTEGHPSADDPSDLTSADASAYARTFLDRAVVDPPDAAFDPLPAGGDVEDHRPALLASLAVTDAELTALLGRTGMALDLPTLSSLVSWAGLARALRVRLSELLQLADLLVPVVADPFASPRVMLDFLDAVEDLRRSGATPTEISFLLEPQLDSPMSSSDDLVAASLSALRESMRSNPAAAPAGQVASYLAGVLRLTPSQVSMLLARSDPTGPLLDAFADAGFTRRDAGGAYVHPVTATDFPRLFSVYRLLQKMARSIELFGLDDERLAWLLEHAPDLGALELLDLPVSQAPPAGSLVSGWLALVRWRVAQPALTLRSATVAATPGSSPAAPTAEPEDLVEAVVGGANVDDVRTIAEVLTGIDVATLASLDGDETAPYVDPKFLLQLLECTRQAERLGVSAAAALNWAQRERAGGPPEAEIATQIRSAAKSKYDTAHWLTTLTPIQDALRERKRSALAAFLLEHSARTQPAEVVIAGQAYANPLRWRDSNDLLRYFLLDVEMSSCQLTSRIKQAIGSAQMFVQRAFMNLEKPHVVVTSEERADTASLDSWRQWKWMKHYRVWEANRKIFLYPENWIQPELRDDKTPFFIEFEQEVLQSEITSENCETALRHYLEKVHEVASLDVIGVHHEIEDDVPWDNLPPTVNLLHVIGRTRSEPGRYFYRRFDLNVGAWSPWEKIEVDITGDQVVPVVYNRVLHLFWLQISEKPQKTNRQPAAEPSSGTRRSAEPPKQLEIRLAWAVRRGTGWSARQVAPQVLVHPWQRPESSYTLRPRYITLENRLWLDVYISMSLEFNNQKFWDPYSGEPEWATSRRFDEAARPWHSSSFVFDGQVVSVRLKPLAGQYHVLDGAGVPSDDLVGTDSYHYVRSLTDPAGRRVRQLERHEVARRLALPQGMHLESGRLANNTWVANTGTLTILESKVSIALLTSAHPPFGIAYSKHSTQFDTAGYNRSPFFYVDTARAYFVTSAWTDVAVDSTTTVRRLQYNFFAFHHPFTSLFLRELNRSGIDGLLNRRIQRFPEQYLPGSAFDFNASYQPAPGRAVAEPSAQRDTLDFSRSGAMSAYNWEIFFHVPFLIACKLMTNQRFEEALDWFHRIFDPTNTDALSAPQRFWITRPFFDQNDEAYRRQRIESILSDLGSRLDEVRAWKNNPFRPDVVARFRSVAYQKVVVMRYIDTLVAWGDQLFRRETIESINEATLLYLLAAELLGRRPEHVPAVPRPAKSYDELAADAALDAFGNQEIEVQLENFTDRPTLVISGDDGTALPIFKLSYFGIPANTELLKYWDTVVDRLFKIRHCMDISGTVRQLPLFEPPIDPAILVRAVAAGVDLDSVLADTPGSGSPYRFRTLLAKAVEFAVDVRSLGERVLIALENRDTEAMSRLQASNEVALQSLIKDVRAAQVTEAEQARAALEEGRALVQARIDYYAAIPYMNPWEIAATVVHGAGVVSEIVATVLNAVAGGARLAPDLTVGAAGFGGSPVATATWGGGNVSGSAVNFASLFQGVSSVLHSTGSMLEAQGNFRRQFDSNQFQSDSARLELAQLEKQIVTAMARENVASRELAAHERTIENVTAVDEYLRTKYTNTELFDWMLAQISTVYFQAYQLAFDMARRAERAYRFEIGDQESPPVIQFGYWDSLKKGLLSGDRLLNDLRRLEATHLERNARRPPATTHVSLDTMMPAKLLELKARGTTSIELPEWLFASENPGWINQRLISVAVSTPHASGPWVGVHGSLHLTQAVVRIDDTLQGGFGDAFDSNDTRFAQAMSAVTSIRFSHGNMDRGIIDTRGGGDDRYTAFEGAGLISRWTITLDPRDNAFDINTLSDVVLTLEYEGDQGGPGLVDLARDAVAQQVPDRGARLYSLDGGYRDEWLRFLHPGVSAEQILHLPVRVDDLPFIFRRAAGARRLTVTGADLVVASAYAGQFEARIAPPGMALGGAAAVTRDPAFGGLHHQGTSWTPGTADVTGEWTLSIKRDTDPTWDNLPDDLIEHAWILLQFAAT
jgi:hypothetical protein